MLAYYGPMDLSVSRYVLGLGVALSLVACGRGPQGPIAMTPAYTPTSKVELGVVKNSGVQLSLTIIDQRPIKDAVGKKSDEQPPVTMQATSADVTRVITDALTRELIAAGFNVVPTGGVVLNFTVLEFWVDEANTYRGTARLKVDAVKDGAPATSLTVTGTAKRWGASLSPENYNEVLSDSLVAAIQDLIKSAEFQAAVVPGGDPAAAAAPAAPAAPAAGPPAPAAPAPAPAAAH